MTIINIPIFDLYMESNLEWNEVEACVKEMEQWLIDRNIPYKTNKDYASGTVTSKFIIPDEDAVAFKLRFGL